MKIKKNQFAVVAFLLVSSLVYSQSTVLWGTTTQGGTYDLGTIYKINSDGTGDSVLYSFTSMTGSKPTGKVVHASNGKLYGIASEGGINNKGALYSFDLTTRVYEKLVDFIETNGASPYSGLIQAHDGKLYGTTNYGGVGGYGTLFCFDTVNNMLTTLHSFDAQNGSVPFAAMVEGTDGKLYGATMLGSPRNVIYSYDIATQTFEKRFTFTTGQGYGVSGGLLQYDDGYFYGVTNNGGAHGYGSLFRFNASTNTCVPVFYFTYAMGRNTRSSLVRANNGLLYGLAIEGGLSDNGTLFSFDPANDSSYTKLMNLDTIDAQKPLGGMMLASNGMLYGATYEGGSNNEGYIFAYNTTNNGFDTILNFNSLTFGANANGALFELRDFTTTITEPLSHNTLSASIYPNPTSDYLHMNLMGLQAENANVYNMNGQLMLTAKQPAGNSINISALPTGIYILEVAVGNKTCKIEWIKM